MKTERTGLYRLLNIFDRPKVVDTTKELDQTNHLSLTEQIIADITLLILNTDLFQLAQSRAEMASRLDDYADFINTNLMKLYLMQLADIQERDLWKKEIVEKIDKMDDLRQSSPYSKSSMKFSASEYYEIIFTDINPKGLDSLHYFTEKLQARYYIYNIEYDETECTKLFVHFFVNISNMLSQKTYNEDKIYGLLSIFDIKK